MFTNHSFISSGQLPPDSLSSSFSLYNKPGILSLKEKPLRSIYLVNNKNKTIEAFWCFSLAQKHAINGFGLPYGSLEFSPQLPLSTLDLFINQSLCELSALNIHKVTLHLKPDFYDPAFQPVLESILIENGFRLKNSDICHYIGINKQTNFESQIHPMERRKLKKLKKEQFHAMDISLDNLSEVYHFISHCRMEKDQQLSLTFDQLQEMVKTYPEHYVLFGVSRHNKLAAATVCVKNTTSILYHFYPASSSTFHSYSPMVMLYEHIYSFCLRNNINLLDLGTSMIANRPNKGLVTFKERMGGMESLKKTYELN